MQATEFETRMIAFTQASLLWCNEEAEKGTAQVTNAVDELLKNIQRVSQMSQDSLEALDKLQGMLQTFDSKNYVQLQKSLQSLAREHSEIDTYIQPVMEALQFQDRLRQNLENSMHMVKVWQDLRAQVAKKGGVSEGELLDFGKALMAKTTMLRERDIIRSYIEGLPAEVPVADVTFF